MEQTLGQGAHVKSRSADHDRLAPRGPHTGEPDACVPGELSRTVALPRIDQIDSEMRHAAELRLVGLRGADIEATVHLPRVCGDG